MVSVAIMKSAKEAKDKEEYDRNLQMADVQNEEMDKLD